MKLFIGDDSAACRELAAKAKTSGETVEYLSQTDFCFKGWLKKDAQKYRQFTHVIICRRVVCENDRDLCELINQFRLIYTAKITVVLDTFSESLVRLLLENGISNICCLDSSKEETLKQLNLCLTKGLEPIYWLRKLPDEEKSGGVKKRITALALAAILTILALGTVIAVVVAASKENTDSKSPSPAEQTTVTTLSSKVTNSGSVTTTAPPETEAATTTTVTTANVASEKKTTTTTKVTTTAKKPDEKVTTTTPHTANSTVTTVKKTEPKKTTTTVKKATTTTKKATSATTTKKKTTTTTTKRKSTTTTTTKKVVTTTTSLVPIPLRGLALKTDSPDNTVYIKVGDTTKVTPIFTPAQATNKKVTWSSNREDRAIVDKNGVVTGRSPGAVIIKCVSDDGGLSAACMIVVTE